MELGEVRRVTLPAFAVIGKEGKGLAEDGGSWVPPLWEQANQHLEELTEVVPEMQEINLWGLMSDEQDWLAPWQLTGRYLAGLEIPMGIPTPKDWQQWEMPAMDYLVVKTDSANLEDMTTRMLTEVLPQQNAELVAAIQEHYLPEFPSGEVELYFPIKKL